MAVLILSTPILAPSAQAHEGWGEHREERFERHERGHWYHGDHEGRLGWWWVVGGAWRFFARPVYPPAEHTTVIVEPAPVSLPPVVVSAPAPAAPQVPMWYFCGSPRGYYPNVPSCPGGWTAVPATPPQG